MRPISATLSLEAATDPQVTDGVASRFSQYIEHLGRAVGNANRRESLAAYCTGLLLPGERKSVEPMAARLAPGVVSAMHQSLHHFVAKARWPEAVLLAAVRTFVLPKMESRASIRAWIVGDSGTPKKGRHSVGVARQYSGERCKQDNCRVAVTLSLASDRASLPIALRLYLPEPWTRDELRRKKSGVPHEIAFQTKPQIALDQVRQAIADGVAKGVVLADAGYGNDTTFRDGLSDMGLSYIVGVESSIALWTPGTCPFPAGPGSRRGRRAMPLRPDTSARPVKADGLAASLPRSMWMTVRWREGSKGALVSRFARLRVRPSHRDYWCAAPRPEEWLLIEWPEGEDTPTKYWLSTLPETTPIATLVDAAKLRWRTERDFQVLKQELGFDHYEGRGWLGFHHHAALSIAAYGFLVSERSAIPLSVHMQHALAPSLPAPREGFQPRGHAVAACTAGCLSPRCTVASVSPLSSALHEAATAGET